MSKKHYTQLMWTLQSTDCTNRSRTAWIVSHSHRIGKSKLKLNRKRVVCHFPLSLVVTGLMIPTICCSALWYTTCKTRPDVWVIFIDSSHFWIQVPILFCPSFFFSFRLLLILCHLEQPWTTSHYRWQAPARKYGWQWFNFCNYLRFHNLASGSWLARFIIEDLLPFFPSWYRNLKGKWSLQWTF